MAKVKRQDLEDLAKLRVEEARVLLAGNRFPGAYYFTGLAIECAIKACIAKQTEQHEFPELERVRESWNHDLEKLIKTAGLEPDLAKTRKASQEFEANWRTVTDWNVKSRYEKKTQQEAEAIYTAATEPQYGVLQWIGRHW